MNILFLLLVVFVAYKMVKFLTSPVTVNKWPAEEPYEPYQRATTEIPDDCHEPTDFGREEPDPPAAPDWDRALEAAARNVQKREQQE